MSTHKSCRPAGARAGARDDSGPHITCRRIGEQPCGRIPVRRHAVMEGRQLRELNFRDERYLPFEGGRGDFKLMVQLAEGTGLEG
jgi:hypothetical protein